MGGGQMVSRWCTTARVASVVLSAVLVTGCKANIDLPAATPSGSSAGTGDHGGSAGGKDGKKDAPKARKELADVKIGSPDSMNGYSRREFGPAWKDVDHNGCDTRNDILARDLDHIKKRNKCVVIAGDLDDPYTGKHITFVKAKAGEVQIDHVFPLGLAWQMGADHWSEDKRTELANDPGNLLAVWGRPNEQKGDDGPAEWKPQKAFQCVYAEKFIGVADHYTLHITHADHDALQDMLHRC